MSTPPRVLLLVASGLLLVASAVHDANAQNTPQGSTVQLNGIDMYYETVGQGDPLLLLHGGTQTARMFDPFVEQLSAHYPGLCKKSEQEK